MKLYCNTCAESFEIPDGSWNKVHCPFCDSTDTAKYEKCDPAPERPERKKETPEPPKKNPLTLPLWIIAICLLIPLLYKTTANIIAFKMISEILKKLQ